MEHNKPFLIEVDANEIENHISANGYGQDFPFEFSKTNMWDSSFFTPEDSNNTSFDTFYSELSEIKLLLKDIKAILSDIFETQTKYVP